MPDPILIDPANRMLSSAPGDLSLYGAPSDPDFAIRPASDAAPVAPPSDAGGDIVVPQPGLLETGDFGELPAPIVQDMIAPSGSPIAFAPPAAPAAPFAETGGSLMPLGLGQTLEAPAFEPREPAGETPLAGFAEGSVLEELGVAPALQVGEAIGSLAEGVDQGVQDLLGSDPTAGIQTLVSLVSVTDLLDLRDAGAENVDGLLDPASAMLDTLSADFVMADPLLGLDPDDAGEHGLPGGAPIIPPIPSIDPLGDGLIHGL